jgi:hypothetical protein
MSAVIHNTRRSVLVRRLNNLACLAVAGLLIASCASGRGAASSTSSTAPPHATTSTEGSTQPTRPPVLTLPGETELQADNRILLACWKDFGIVPELQPDGSYTWSAPNAQQINDECQKRLVAAGLQGDFPLTAEQIRAAYDHAKAWRQCAIDHGHPLPPMISFEEYAASGGKSPHVVDGVTEMLGSLTRGAYKALMKACPQD